MRLLLDRMKTPSGDVRGDGDIIERVIPGVKVSAEQERCIEYLNYRFSDSLFFEFSL